MEPSFDISIFNLKFPAVSGTYRTVTYEAWGSGYIKTLPRSQVYLGLQGPGIVDSFRSYSSCPRLGQEGVFQILLAPNPIGLDWNNWEGSTTEAVLLGPGELSQHYENQIYGCSEPKKNI